MTVFDSTLRARSVRRIRRVGYVIGRAVIRVSVVTFLLWSTGAIYYHGMLPRFIGCIFAVAYATGLGFLWRRTEDKPRWLSMAAGSIVIVYLFTLIQRPSHDREWDPDHARLPDVSIDGDRVTVANFRHCRYRSESDYDVHYRQLEFPLSRLSKVWFGVQRFTALEELAHTFLSFEIDNVHGPDYFCVSVEIRREKGEMFSPIQGLYRQYELIYVIADERDVIGVRTIHRPDDRVCLYPVNATSEQVQSLFRDIAGRTQAIRNQPEFYHSLLNNCTNNIAEHATRLTPSPLSWLDPRIVIPGYSDRLAFARGLIGPGPGDFESLQSACRIDRIAARSGMSADFSAVIRKQLDE